MLSVVTPVHNEGKVLAGNAEKILDFLASQTKDYELVLVENGSSDNTLGEAEALAIGHPEVRVFPIPEKDLGQALRKGILSAKGEYLIWYPIDLSVDLDFIPRSLRDMGEYDIVVGSKDHPDSSVVRSKTRKILSFFYNSMVNLLFNLKLSDTQCVKTFKAESVVALAEKAHSEGIMWEVELLFLARKAGLRIKEVPVKVFDVRKASKIRPWDMLQAFINLFRLRLSYKKNR